MKEDTLKLVAELRGLSAGVLRHAMQIHLPPVDVSERKSFADETEATKFFASWVASARKASAMARATSGVIEKLLRVAPSLDKEMDRMELFAEARALLKKDYSPRESMPRKAYDAARIAVAVREGFKE